MTATWPPGAATVSLTPDQAAAHHLLCELRTRIATQRLPYQHGVEPRALESLREVFDHARDAMKENPGCSAFARRATDVLNTVLRPITAKWHPALVEGRLASKDGSDELRGDLEEVRTELRAFALELQEMAYGANAVAEDAETPPALEEAELRACLEPLAFGIPLDRADVAADGLSLVTNPTTPGQSRPLDPVALMNASEAADVKERRQKLGRGGVPGKDAVGLALSGGGIRSATFCLGVVQVLAERKLIEDVDFLSTVSGGGYTGSFLSATLAGPSAAAALVGSPHGPDPVPVARLRARAKYLTSANLWETWSKVTATVAGMLLNWTAPLAVVFGAALVAVAVDPEHTLDGAWPSILSIAGGAMVLSLLVYAALTRAGRTATLVGGRTLAAASGVTALIGVLWALVIGHEGIPKWLAEHWPVPGAMAALIGAGPAIIRFVPVLRKPLARLIALKVLLTVAALLIPVLGVAAFYVAWDLGTASSVTLPALGPYAGQTVLRGATLGLAAIAIVLIDVNLTGPHRLYRDSLARAFIGDGGGPALRQMNVTDRAPYHLINATVNLPSSPKVTIRDRKGDFFVFSRHWCGSMATGFHKTEDWKAGWQPIDLKTAMAISGAAASSHMGLSSMPALTALITFLNVRLGFWLANPRQALRWLRWPGFLCLLREMLGVGMSEDSAWFNLSDGGHIENTGCYELLRRRCKYIIAVDGEADPEFTFGGLMTLIRHVQIDLGIDIDPRLNDLRPSAKTGYSQRHTMFCRIHYPATADGRPAATGLLLYLKASATGNESELIKQYRAKHPEFPHQSTLDQFFDQEQFEAHRQLGVHVAEGLFSRALLEQGSPPPAAQAPASTKPPPTSQSVGAAPLAAAGQTVPSGVADWFERLARNLLYPRRS